ncbi:hypothetical protein Bca52824_062814 [Brassica carinata]|uniref:Glyoxal oxidase N-terminal domain-containing protein n=1 Tax=Brassica carinata TaxID=52824 RepID=A0A8X7U7L8_BRACI|nr:hypothetical protein Bca52824_062814 [Brassica carinata]
MRNFRRDLGEITVAVRRKRKKKNEDKDRKRPKFVSTHRLGAASSSRRRRQYWLEPVVLMWLMTIRRRRDIKRGKIQEEPIRSHFSFFFLCSTSDLLLPRSPLAILTGGRWNLLQPSIGISAMHIQLLHNNKVVIFDRTDYGPSNLSLPSQTFRNATVFDCSAHSLLYDVASNTFRPLTLQSDTWCSSGSLNASGSLIQTGGYGVGERAIRIFTPCEGVSCDWVENRASILFDFVNHRIVKEFPEIPGGDKRNYPSTGSSVLLPLFLTGENNRSKVSAEVLVCGGAPPGAFLKAAARTIPKIFVGVSHSRRRGKETGTDPVGGEERKGHEESTRLADLGEVRVAAVLKAEEGATVQRDKAEPWKKRRGGRKRSVLVGVTAAKTFTGKS